MLTNLFAFLYIYKQGHKYHLLLCSLCVYSHISVGCVADILNHGLLQMQTRNFIEYSVQDSVTTSMDNVIAPGLFAKSMV